MTTPGTPPSPRLSPAWVLLSAPPSLSPSRISHEAFFFPPPHLVHGELQHNADAGSVRAQLLDGETLMWDTPRVPPPRVRAGNASSCQMLLPCPFTFGKAKAPAIRAHVSAQSSLQPSSPPRHHNRGPPSGLLRKVGEGGQKRGEQCLSSPC